MFFFYYYFILFFLCWTVSGESFPGGDVWMQEKEERVGI